MPGTLSMANTGQPNSGGSQFFLNVANNVSLDWFSPGESRHPVFGEIIQGYDIVVAISKAQVDPSDRPIQPIMMRMMRVMFDDGAGPPQAPPRQPQQQQQPNPCVVMET